MENRCCEDEADFDACSSRTARGDGGREQNSSTSKQVSPRKEHVREICEVIRISLGQNEIAHISDFHNLHYQQTASRKVERVPQVIRHPTSVDQVRCDAPLQEQSSSRTVSLQEIRIKSASAGFSLLHALMETSMGFLFATILGVGRQREGLWFPSWVYEVCKFEFFYFC